MAVVDIDRLKSFFNELETRKALLTTITQLHKTLTEHFESVEQSYTEKSQALDTQIETFDAQTSKTLDSLGTRENAIPELESSAAARIEEQREAAVSDIEKAGSGDGGGDGDKGLSDLLRMYCRRMDSKGLVRFVLAKRKDSAVLKTEIAAAVEEAVDVRRLVLDAVEEFVEMKVEGKVRMADRRWACGMLIQAALPIDPPGGGGGVATSLRERAAAVLERWKGLMSGGENGVGGGAGEASMFLQLVVSFGLKERFDEEYLRKLVVESATRWDMAKIALALSFGDKFKDIIDGFVKSGKEIEAVYFASESGLTEQFPPVTLLKTCLRNCRKNANSISKTGKFSAAAVEEANNSELNTTKAIIKCVEDHKLESQFAIDTLKQRVTQLEKAKADKKKAAGSTSKPSNKRSHGGSSRGSGGGRLGGGRPSTRPPKAARFSNPSPSFLSRNPSQLQQAATAAGRYPSAYNYPGQASYAQGYSGQHTQNPASLTQQHAFAPHETVPAASRAGPAYGGSFGGQPGYPGYDYAAQAGSAAYPTYPPQ